MTPIVILEAFGELRLTELINAERDRERRERANPPTGVTVMGLLHSAFDARAELMGCRPLRVRLPVGACGTCTRPE